MEQQFAAFVASQQQKEAPKEQSAINKAVAKALGERSTNGGGPSGTNGTKKTRKPSKRCVFYCHSHGCNFSHNSPECSDKKTGHIDAATCTKPNNGKMWNKDIYTGTGCLHCNEE